jgi:predicted TIM-barrel fold metal-dependent hydrolase
MDAPLAFVDAHQHFQDLDNHYYPWLCDADAGPKLEGDLTPIRRTYLPPDYSADVHTARVTKTVHVQNGWDPRDPAGETRWLQGLADRHGFPQAIIAYADLAAPDVQAVLEAHLACTNMRGIRQILNWHETPMLRVAPRADLMEDAAWRRGFALLGRYGLSFDLQIYWPQMDSALQLGRAFPDVPLVLNHFGMPIDRSPSGVASWTSALQRLAQAPNVFIKLSGFGLGHPAWTIEDTAPLLTRSIDLFGPARAMFGTNLPVDRLFAEPPRIIAMIAAVASRFSGDERHHLLCSTAERVYRLG